MRIVAGTLLAVLLSAMAAAVTPPTSLPEYAQAKAVAQQVLKDTRALLEKELAEKGPVAAIQACSKTALQEARKHEQAGWRVRRVSLKNRNPADAPDAWERRVLRRFEDSQARGALRPENEQVAIVTTGARSELRYVKPITVASAGCLLCHGAKENLDPAVRAALRKLYPRDRATGYRAGDLRGAISVSIPLAQVGRAK